MMMMMMMLLLFDELPEHCKALVHPHWLATSIAALLVMGILGSYMPQMIKIYSNGTSAGLSPYWILLGGLSSICAFGNIVALPASREDMACCSLINAGACTAALLGVAQLVVQCGCFMIVVVFFVWFFPTNKPADSDIPDSEGTSDDPPANEKHRLIVACTIPSAAFVVFAITVVITVGFHKYDQFWADLLGTIAGILAAIQYVPQIFYTWKLQDLKSLSVLTLLVQAPGAFVFAASLANRVGIKRGWSTWLPYVVTGSLQLILLGMAAWFKSNQSSQTGAAMKPQGHGNSERDPLLPQSTA